tara:strand:- start:1675 stop:2649 length:975 start_codon:yes stop_codon:yes gene_type:complete
MANSKSYAYQIKGSKISLLQDQFINDAVGNAYGANGKPSWVSPNESVSEGIEVEYAYSPTYVLPELRAGTRQFGIVGWTIVGGYLTFLASGTDWTGGAPHTNIGVNEHIYVGNSSRWEGLHKVKDIGDADGVHGGIQTYTKVSQSTHYFTDISVDFSVTNIIENLTANFNDGFTSSTEVPYIWITGSAADPANNGLFSDWSFSSTTLDLSLASRHHVASGDELTYLSSTPVLSNEATTPVYIREAFYDPAYIVADVEVLSDESDTIDLPPYLANALVYYVKAKLAEDIGEIELKEYNMREFRVMVGRHSSSKLAGGSRRVRGYF